MAPIDYSKWDNIDTDSESEVSPTPVPAATTNPPSKTETEQPAATASVAVDVAGSGTVRVVIVKCNGEKRMASPWSALMISDDHPVFSEAVPSIPALVEVPLVIYPVGTRSQNRADLDSQITTCLNIDAESGVALPKWQSHVGTVIVARKDKKPLLPHHVEGIWMYCDRILDLFGNGEGAPRKLYNRQAFERWWKSYCAEQKGFRFGNGGESDVNDWREIKSPYEM